MSPSPSLSDVAVEDGVETPVQGANPFVGLTPGQVASAAGRWAGALGRRPSVLAQSLLGWVGEQAKVVGGTSEIQPEPKDRRFSDPVWSNPLWRRVAHRDRLSACRPTNRGSCLRCSAHSLC